jgi:hypothetical protein
MYGAYHAVDNFQKLFGKDLEGNKWKWWISFLLKKM